MQPCEQQPAGTVPLTQLKEYFVPNRCLIKACTGGGEGEWKHNLWIQCIQQSTASNHAKSHRESPIKLWGQPKMADW